MGLPIELVAENLVGMYNLFDTYNGALGKYFSPQAAPGTGRFIAYNVFAYNRAMSQLTSYGGPVPKGQMPVRDKVTYEAITTQQAISLDVDTYNNLVQSGTMQANGQAQLATAIRQVRMNIERRLDWLRAQWLTGGAMLSSSGVAPVEPSSTGVAYLDYPELANSTPLAIPLGFTATHMDAGATASWATTTTDIFADLETGRAAIAFDSGIDDAYHVILNSKTMGYIYRNAMVTSSVAAQNQIVATGKLGSVWGYTFDVIDLQLPFDSETMATDTGATGMIKAIPDNLVIITTQDNMRAGRIQRECKPGDYKAPDSARGVWAFSDEDAVFPHEPTVGFTWTGGMELGLPDASYLYTDVTQTS